MKISSLLTYKKDLEKYMRRHSATPTQKENTKIEIGKLCTKIVDYLQTLELEPAETVGEVGKQIIKIDLNGTIK